MIRSKTKITFLVSQLGFGGAERQTYELVRKLQETRNYELRCICLSETTEPYGRLMEAVGLPLDIIPRKRSFDLERVRRIRELSDSSSTDILHCIHYEAAAYGFGATLGRRRPFYLPSIRSTVVRPRPVKTFIYTKMLRSAPAVIVNSHRGAAFIGPAFGVPQERLHVIGNGLPFESIEERARQGTDLREELALGLETPLLGFVGKDSKHKNVHRFLEVCRELESARPELHFVLVGWRLAEEDRPRLGLLSPRYHLLGIREDVPAIMRSLNLLIMSSNTEGCPNTLIEAAVLGTPVVAPDVGDVARILAPFRERSVTVDQEPASYAALARGWLDAPPSPGDVEQMRTWVREHYALDTMIASTMGVYEALLHG